MKTFFRRTLDHMIDGRTAESTIRITPLERARGQWLCTHIRTHIHTHEHMRTRASTHPHKRKLKRGSRQGLPARQRDGSVACARACVCVCVRMCVHSHRPLARSSGVEISSPARLPGCGRWLCTHIHTHIHTHEHMRARASTHPHKRKLKRGSQQGSSWAALEA